jgi:hypothetical protein
MLSIFSIFATRFRVLAWAAFCLLSAPTFAQPVTVVEYYNRALDAYFMTGRSVEQTLLDGLPTDFSRTGMEFTAIAATAATAPQVRICRFYVNTVTPFTNSHFYGREGTDCEALRAQNLAGFSYEDFDFAVAQPDALNTCAASTPVRVFRSFRPGTATRTSNHRYTTSVASFDALTGAGWTPEQAVFCVTSAKDATLAPASSFKHVVSLPTSPFVAACNGQVSGASGVLYSGAEVEPSLARNPANPNHMIASWQQDRWSNGGSQSVAGAVTFDGGKTWTNSLAAFSRCSGGSTANAGNYDRASDPWVSIAADGTAFQMALGVSGESFTASSISAMLVSRSTDGGRTWGAAQALVRDASATIFHDKNSLTADPTNAAFVYAVWDRLENNIRAPSWFTRTTNGGLSWEPSRSIYDPGSSNQTLANQIVVLPDSPNGTLVNVFLDIIRAATSANAAGQRVRIVRSGDKGATWSAPVTVAEYLGVGTRDPVTNDAVRDGTGVPSIAVGADGRLHVVWQDARFGRGDYDSVAYAQSRDGGLTWSTPVAINARLDVAAFVPTVHVRSDGTIGVTYYDFRADTSDRATLPTVYRLATSKDGVNWRESGVEDPFELRQAPVAHGYFLGDYQALSSNGSAFSALYARTGGSVANNATEIVFANVADGSLKRAGDAYVAQSAPQDFVATPALTERVRAQLERVIANRREKFIPRMP